MTYADKRALIEALRAKESATLALLEMHEQAVKHERRELEETRAELLELGAVTELPA